mmetsp:Transcript_38904/g.99469  ORF Transcript_38904/g.99469 Transcript_38904/m.99469 type:complete len:234 (-) Transcript_38904:1175-1876(-)
MLQEGRDLAEILGVLLELVHKNTALLRGPDIDERLRLELRHRILNQRAVAGKHARGTVALVQQHWWQLAQRFQLFNRLQSANDLHLLVVAVHRGCAGRAAQRLLALPTALLDLRVGRSALLLPQLVIALDQAQHALVDLYLAGAHEVADGVAASCVRGFVAPKHRLLSGLQGRRHTDGGAVRIMRRLRASRHVIFSGWRGVGFYLRRRGIRGQVDVRQADHGGGQETVQRHIC